MNKNEVWEMTHRILGIDVKVYDIIVAIFIGILTIFIVIVNVLNWVKGEHVISGEYLSNGFTSFNEQNNLKVFRVAAFKSGTKKIGMGKKDMREDIICTSCGASLMTSH
jgi:hypothetical protein